jgi:hypothetical protein
MTDINKIVNTAKELLEKESYDEGHDWIHHQQVWDNAKQIVDKEKIEVDKVALQVACYWHDVMVENVPDKNFRNRGNIIDNTCKYLEKLMSDLEFEPDTITKTLTAIKEHERKSVPKTTEGKVLWDGDKLEWLSCRRWLKIYQSFKDKKMSKLKMFLYKRAGKLWLKTLRKRYSFDYTRQLHDQRVQEILHNKQILAIADEFGENLTSILLG